MNNPEWELSKWGDGTTRIVKWDYMHGEDVMIILEADGKAYLHHYDENEIEVRTPIDLVLYFRGIAQ